MYELVVLGKSSQLLDVDFPIFSPECCHEVLIQGLIRQRLGHTPQVISHELQPLPS